MCLPCLIIIQSCYCDYRIDQTFTCSRCMRDLRFLLCSRDLDTLRSQRIMCFLILVTHKSTRSENNNYRFVGLPTVSYQTYSLVSPAEKPHTSENTLFSPTGFVCKTIASRKYNASGMGNHLSTVLCLFVCLFVVVVVDDDVDVNDDGNDDDIDVVVIQCCCCWWCQIS